MDIYVASKAKYAPHWRHLEPVLSSMGFPFKASWIHHEGQADSNLWITAIREAVSADALLAMLEPGETHKGDLVEIGAHLGAGGTVIVVGKHPEGHSWMKHPRVIEVDSMESAIVELRKIEVQAKLK